MATYTTDIKDGISITHCLQCGAEVPNEARHEREHESAAPTFEGVEEAESE